MYSLGRKVQDKQSPVSPNIEFVFHNKWTVYCKPNFLAILVNDIRARVVVVVYDFL